MIWLGTTRNLAGTHRCFNLTTLQEITGDHFSPVPITQEAITRINCMAGTVDLSPVPVQPQLDDPSSPYALDPLRGQEDLHLDENTAENNVHSGDIQQAPALIVPADSMLAVKSPAQTDATDLMTDITEPDVHLPDTVTHG